MKKVLLATLFAAFSLGMSAQAFEYVPLDANTGRPLVPNVPSVPSVPSIQSYFCLPKNKPVVHCYYRLTIPSIRIVG